jgi:phage shock protein E
MNNISALLLGLTVVGALTMLSCRHQPSAPRITHVVARQAAALPSRPDVIVLDLRTPKEFAGGHIAGAKLVDFQSPNFATAGPTRPG